MTPSNDNRQDTLWQGENLTNTYLNGVRGAIPLASEQIDLIIRLAHASRPEARLILDLGCGDGILGYSVLETYPIGSAKVIFVDFSEPMLDAARARNSGADAVFLQVDYSQHDWPTVVGHPGEFDIIVSGFSIHHQPDPIKRAIYQSIFNLLSPGGIFLNLEHVASASPWGEAQFEEYFIDSLFRYHGPQGLTRDQVANDFYRRPDKVANILSPIEEQCRWLGEIGFERVDCFFKVFELALFGGIKPPN